MSTTNSTSNPRPPMFLFLAIKFALITMPLSILSALLFVKLGISDIISMILGGLAGWWIVGKYDEILIEVVDYMREKYDQDTE